VPGKEADRAEAALASERRFVSTLGGLVLGIAGAELVTHERIPIPRFNFVQVSGVDRGRQSAFFERTLDHYFQRALRPTFRIPLPEPEHLKSGLLGFGFRPRPQPIVLLVGEAERAAPPSTDLSVRPATNAELDEVGDLLDVDAGRAEFRTAIDIAWHAPNPGETLTPIVATRDDRIVSAGLRYEVGGSAGLHFITTRTGDRGQGAASSLAMGAFALGSIGADEIPYLFADSSRLEQHLSRLGFTPALSFREYTLPPEVELAFPPPGPATPPRWRPPRDAPAREAP
jgi:hypothetical protein